MRCPVLTSAPRLIFMVLACGYSELVLAPPIALRVSYAMPGADIGYAATRRSCSRSDTQVKSAIALRACYAMSGTDIAYGGSLPHAADPTWYSIPLRTYYAMSGTDISYGATTSPQRDFALAGTNGYLPTPPLCDVRY
eukprot:3052503-Rhodomonas_salina.2